MQAVDEHGHHGDARFVNDATDAGLRGQERVRVVISLARALRVQTREDAAAPQQKSQLREARGVQRRLLAFAKNGRIHGEEAHDAVDEQTRAESVEKAGAHRKHDALLQPAAHQLGRR